MDLNQDFPIKSGTLNLRVLSSHLSIETAFYFKLQNAASC